MSETEPVVAEPIDVMAKPDRPLRDGLGLLVRAAKLHRGVLALAVAGGVVFGISLVAASSVLGRLTDDLIVPAFDEGVSRGRVFAGAAVFLAVITLRSVAAVARRWFGAMATRRVAQTRRGQIAERYLGVPMRYFRSNPTGELLAHADTDIEVSTMVMNMVPCLLYTSPSPRDATLSRMPSSA